jgi:2-dehydropantoate 2-reductase
MHITIFGTGGVGGFFGAKLAQAGEDVVFIARGAHLEAIQKNGLAIESITGDFKIQPANAVGSPSQAGPTDVVLVAVKAWQVPEAALALRDTVSPETIVIPLENGVEAPDQLAAELGKDRVTGGLCGISAFIAAPGVIRHVGIQPYIKYNWFDAHPDPRLAELQEAFSRVGVQADIPADIQAAMWMKFIFIAAISGVGAAARTPVGDIRTVPETRALLEAAIHEVAAVGRACGTQLPERAEENVLRTIDGLPPGTIPSMQRDIMDGRPSELDFQTGSVVRLGRAKGVPAPVNETIYAALLPQERRVRGENAA